jgi:hypothetical protein
MCLTERSTYPQVQPFPIELRRAAVYSYLLHECLYLTDSHARTVEHYWGLRASFMIRQGYVVTPSPIAKIVIEHEISKRFGSHIEGVAGFYCDGEGVWRLNVGATALLIPVRGPRGFIVGVQICSAIGTGNLYWFTSKDKPCGASAIATPHVANFKRARETGVVMLINNTVLADERACEFNVGVVGINNCKTGVLLNTLDELSITHVFDALWPSGTEMSHTYSSVLRAVERAGIKVRAV